MSKLNLRRSAGGMVCCMGMSALISSGFAMTKHFMEEKGLKSEAAEVTAKIIFVNQSKQEVKVCWLDYTGRRVVYKNLKPGKSYTQDTYLTNPWLVTDLDDNAWDVYMPAEDPRTVIITEPRKN